MEFKAIRYFRGLLNLNNSKPRNKFTEAFLSMIGSGYTNYDNNMKTYVEKGYNHNPMVYSVINQQAIKTSSIPFYVKKIKDKSARMKYNGILETCKYDPSPQQLVKLASLHTKAFEDDSQPFPMERPNIMQSWTEFLALYKTFLKLTGNVYIYILSPTEGQRAGEPMQVYLLPSHQIKIIVKDKVDLFGDMESPIDHYCLIEGKTYIDFESQNVIHVKYPNPNYDQSGEHLYGQAPLKAALRNVQTSNEAIDLNNKSLQSGGAFGLIHAKNSTLNPEQAKDLKERLTEMDNSPGRLAKIAGVSAEVGFTRLSLTSDELKPFDYLEFDEKMIHKVLNWAYDDGNRGDYGGTINELRKMRITDDIMPDLKLLQEALNKYFLPRFKNYQGYVIEFDASELPEMQIDMETLVKWVSQAVDKGIINRDEGRIALRFTKTEDKNMETYTVQQGTISLEDALDMPEFN